MLVVADALYAHSACSLHIILNELWMDPASPSALEFVLGLSGAVKYCFIPNVWQVILASLDINALPLSLGTDIPLVTPCQATTLSNRTRTTVSALVSSTAISSGHMLVVCSIFLAMLEMDRGGPNASLSLALVLATI